MTASIHELSGGMKSALRWRAALGPKPARAAHGRTIRCLWTRSRREQLYGDIQRIGRNARRPSCCHAIRREPPASGAESCCFAASRRIREQFQIDFGRVA